MKVVANMNLKTLVGWLNKMNETTVTVQIPRFRIEDSMSLKEELKKMGLEDLFSATHASLPGTIHVSLTSLIQNFLLLDS